MTLAIINALDSSPLPKWLTFIILVAIFIVASVVSGYLTFKYRVNNREKLENRENKEPGE